MSATESRSRFLMIVGYLRWAFLDAIVVKVDPQTRSGYSSSSLDFVEDGMSNPTYKIFTGGWRQNNDDGSMIQPYPRVNVKNVSYVW